MRTIFLRFYSVVATAIVLMFVINISIAIGGLTFLRLFPNFDNGSGGIIDNLVPLAFLLALGWSLYLERRYFRKKVLVLGKSPFFWLHAALLVVLIYGIAVSIISKYYPGILG